MNRRRCPLKTKHSSLRRQQRTRQIYHRILSSVLLVAIVAVVFSINLFFIKVKASSENEAFRYKYYTSVTVGSGETLWDIATEFISEDFTSVNNYIKEVKNINHITDNTIYAGEELVVPYYSSEYKN